MNYDLEGVPRGSLKPWQRLKYVAPWHLTNWGWLPEYFFKLNPGGDEVRGCRYIILPLLGELVWFDKEECSDPECYGHNDSFMSEAEIHEVLNEAFWKFDNDLHN